MYILFSLEKLFSLASVNMEITKIYILTLTIILVVNRNVITAENPPNPGQTAKFSEFNPLENLIIHQNKLGTSKIQREPLSRVKRQYGYGYGQYGRNRYYPLPIFSGGIAYPAVGAGGYGYGGRGFGGRGFGGRGIGGRGFGGRGIGGRGIGGRGGIGGGRGGRG